MLTHSMHAAPDGPAPLTVSKEQDMSKPGSKTATKVPPLIQNPWHLFLAVAATVRRLCLHGMRPGTGKTTAGIALSNAQGAEVVCVTMTDGKTEADLLGCWLPAGPGKVTWHDAPIGYAIRRATDGTRVVLVLNEIDRGGPEAKDVCYALLECDVAANFTLPNGEKLTIPDTLTIVATCNPDPKDVLPEPVVNRFQVIIDVADNVSPMILEALPDPFKAMVADGRMAAREAFAMLDMVTRGLDPYIAIQAVLGNERAENYADALALALS